MLSTPPPSLSLCGPLLGRLRGCNKLHTRSNSRCVHRYFIRVSGTVRRSTRSAIQEDNNNKGGFILDICIVKNSEYEKPTGDLLRSQGFLEINTGLRTISLSVFYEMNIILIANREKQNTGTIE